MSSKSVSQLEQTREFVSQVFSDFEGAGCLPFQETVLIRDGHYCGHRFTTDHHKAVWFLEENEVKFFDANGRLLRVAACVEKPAEVYQPRRAA